MTKVLLLSDTHSFIDDKILHYAQKADEIWHAGDWGLMPAYQKIAETGKKIRAVTGNIDDASMQHVLPEELLFTLDGLKVYMIHIGGYPGNYKPNVLRKLKEIMPDIFICGHSHVLKVMRDPMLNNMLHLNPGAAGQHGFHRLRTWLTFDIKQGKIKDLNVIECSKFEKE